MSRVAEGHFREETRSALDIEGNHVTIQGPSLDLTSSASVQGSYRCRPPAASLNNHEMTKIREARRR